ncbi:hypothetical protein HYU06_01520 [Candidatus Woesearchaeota archaeon]|nr:hypothetical protein [Candidatus Woesearchaeota archaeon]
MMFECDGCHRKYYTEEDALDCEKEQDILTMMNFDLAKEHPEQKRLI